MFVLNFVSNNKQLEEVKNVSFCVHWIFLNLALINNLVPENKYLLLPKEHWNLSLS